MGQVKWWSGGKIAQTQSRCIRHRIRCCIVISPSQRITISLDKRQLRCDRLTGFGWTAASPLSLQINTPPQVRTGVTGVGVVGNRVVVMEVEAENGRIGVLRVAGVSSVRHS